MRQSSDDYTAVLEQARLGSASAIEQLVHGYEREVRLVARVQMGAAIRPYLDSVDVVQSVHRSLILGLQEDKFDISSPEKLVSLAMTMVRRKVARHWRRMKRQERLSGTRGRSTNLFELLTALSCPVPNPAQIVEFQDQVQNVCRGLTETEGRLIELRLQGYSTAEVARELGLKSNALRVQLSRLRTRLRDNGLVCELL